MSEASALWFQAREEAAILPESLPVVTDGWCEIRTQFSALSPGTERLVYTARVPPELAGHMRCPYMGGAFTFPVKYGYSLVGTVSAGPADWLGRTVHVLHPHQDQCVVRCEDAYAFPPDVPPGRATLASNLETAVNVLWDAQVALGERVLVVGFGIVGSLVARLLSLIPGVQLEVVDAAPAKQRLARASLQPRPRLSPLFDGIQPRASSRVTVASITSALRAVVELSWMGPPVTVQLSGTFPPAQAYYQLAGLNNWPRRHSMDNQRRKGLMADPCTSRI